MLPSDVGAFERERLEALAEKRNTTVLTVEHDEVRDPWPTARVRPVLERLAARVAAAPDDADNFRLRKACVADDEEARDFQRAHPKLFWMVTDAKMVREARFRNALAGLLRVREQVERGEVPEGRDADALATRTVLGALQE